MEPRWTIYCHTHVASGRRYVGLTKKTVSARWNQHVYTSGLLQKKGWSHFANAIRKYGKDAFSHEVLEVCETLEAANAAEEKWIIHFDTRNPEKGFNFMKGGHHVPHPVRNPWDRPEFRTANAGRNVHHLLTPEARDKQKASLRSPESRAKRSALAKSSMSSPETVEKRKVLYSKTDLKSRISSSLKFTLSDPSVRAEMSSRTAALHRDPDYRGRLSSSHAVAMASLEVRSKLSVASKRSWSDPGKAMRMTGRRLSDETRAKIAASSIGRLHSPDSVEKQRALYLERSSVCKFCDSRIDGKRTCIRGRVACHDCKALKDLGIADFLRPDGSFLIP